MMVTSLFLGDELASGFFFGFWFYAAVLIISIAHHVHSR